MKILDIFDKEVDTPRVKFGDTISITMGCNKQNVYILANTEPDKLGLINIETGKRWGESKHLNKDQFSKMREDTKFIQHEGMLLSELITILELSNEVVTKVLAEVNLREL